MKLTPAPSSGIVPGSKQTVLFGKAAIAACGLLLVAQLILKIRDGLYFDDTFMFVRYAHNIIKYGNYGWNAHEHTYGCTNIPFTYFVVILKLLKLDQLMGLSTLMLLCSFFWAILSLALLYRIILSLTASFLGSSNWLVALFIGSIAITPVFSYNIITGMDTTMSLFFNVFMIGCLLRCVSRPGKGTLLLAAFSCYFIFLLRPDNGIYALLFPVLFLWDAKWPLKKIAGFYFVLFILFALDTLIKYRYFGNPLPLPFFVKKSGFYLGYLGRSNWNAVQYSFDFFFDFGFLFFALLLFAGKESFRKFMVFGIPVLLSVAYYFTVTQIMGFHSRYYLPSMPFWIIGAVYGFREIASFQITTNKAVTAISYVLVLLFLQLAAPAYELYVQKKSQQEAVPFALSDRDNGLDSTGRPGGLVCKPLGYKDGIHEMEKLVALLPPSATIAATEYGHLSIAAPDNPFMDLCGLHNMEFALHGYSDKLLQKWNPTLMWLPANEYTALRKQIITGDYFRQQYDFFPSAFSYGVAVLKSAPEHDNLVKKIIELNCH